MDWIFSALCLTIIIGSCALGVLAPKHVYDANLPQKLGMVGVILFSLPKLIMVVSEQQLQARCMPADAQLFGHAGLALYCVGTAAKVLYWRIRLRSMGTA